MSDKKTNALHQEPIAIVGMGGLFPGSEDLTAFWQNILEGADLITDIPDTHWKVSDYYDSDLSAVDKTYATRGGFLPMVDFDALGFGIPPNLVPMTDTSQLLGLLVARDTLNDATGGKIEETDKSRISCILGVTSGQELLCQMASRLRRPEWVAGMRAAGVDADTANEAADKIAGTMTEWTEATFPGLLGNVVAGRIANRLDLGGTNAVTDAACASSFAAISMAIDELHLGKSDMVLTGGVDTLNDIFMHMCFSKTPALSKTGDVRPFDNNGDGTLLGEGLGMVALKRLSDAEAAGDKIYALIKGVGTSSDGRSKSVYAPVSEGQSNALKRAYDRAGFEPRSIELVECHGTGTKAGDAAELGGLKLALESGGNDDKQWVAVGSVKSQIGHTKAAAGSAGLIKAALALHHRVLPPTIKVGAPNGKVDFQDSPFYVNNTLRPWVRGSDHPRRAGVSSFGFGGSNFHIALEEYTGNQRAPEFLDVPVSLFTVSSGTVDGLKAALSTLKADAANLDAKPFAFARLAQASQTSFKVEDDQRLSLVADSVEQLVKLVDKATAALAKEGGRMPPGVAYGSGKAPQKLAFLFSGQGSQVTNMGLDLALYSDAARTAFDDANDAFTGDKELSRIIFPAPAFDDDTAKAQQSELTQTENAQPALGATSVAGLRFLADVGVTPDLVAGHSFGELTALHAAGVVSYADLIKMARKRGELMAAASELDGAMAAIVAGADEVRALLDESGVKDVVIANENAPTQTVVSGVAAQVDAFVKFAGDKKVRAKKLPVSTAFHSPVVDGACQPLADFLADIDFNKANVPVFGNTSSTVYPTDVKEQKSTLANQLGKPVRFVEQVKNMEADGATLFIEVGPGNVLANLASKILSDAGKNADTLALLPKGKGFAGPLALLGELLARGVAVDVQKLSAHIPAVVETKKPKLTVKINGANAGKPLPPEPVAAKVNEVVKEVIVEKPVEVVVEKIVEKPVAASNGVNGAAPTPFNGNGVNGALAATPLSPALQTITATSSVTGALMTDPKNPTVLPAQPVATTGQGWLDVFRETQAQTAQAHAAYQASMAQSHVAFLQAFEHSANALTSLMTGAPLPTQVAQPVVAQPVVAQPVIAQPVVAQPVVAQPVVAQPVAAPAPVAAPVVATPAPVVAKPAAAPAPVAAKPVAAAPAAAANVDVKGAFLEVVAEKTGYPADALELDMNLEADLGIDSIKRVEILGAIKDKVPGLPELDAVAAASLTTLGMVIDALADGALAASAPAAAAPAAAATGSVDVKGAFLEVVAEKTGYPADALDLEMNLEADLGIDSIKRVEILGAIKDKVPGLPELDAVAAASLTTLGMVIDALSAGAPAAGGSANAAPAALAQASAPAVAVDVKTAFLEVVAEKTGYPADALDLEMNLEADLGIDSIKRVEILGAIKDKVPGLPELDAVAAASLTTLGMVIDALSDGAPAAAPAAAAPAADAGGNVKGVFLDVVAEKTGYPTDALELEMNLEADLGIDSIKRVEILGAVKERAPQVAEIDAMQLSQLATLGEICNALEGGASLGK